MTMAYLIESKCNGCGACVRFCPVGAIAGAKNELHMINDALCIECGVCGKVCPQKVIVDPLGMVCEPIKRSLWPKVVCSAKNCTSCGICIVACPTGALSLFVAEDSADKHLAPLLEEKKCIACGFCVEECPFDAMVMR